MKNISRLCCAVVIVASSATSAQAGNGPEGFYLGAGVDVGKTKNSFTIDGVDIGSIKESGTAYGGLLGYRYTFDGGFILGLEGNLRKSDLAIDIDDGVRAEADWGWAVLLNAGHMLSGNTALYAFGGIGRSSSHLSVDGNDFSTTWNDVWTLGAAFEFFASDHVSLRLTGSYSNGQNAEAFSGGFLIEDSPTGYGGGVDLIFGF